MESAKPVYAIPSICMVLMCLFLLSACLGPGQVGLNLSPGRPKPPDDRFLSTVYDTRPFSLKTVSLPPMYIGHNPELVHKGIRVRYEVSARDPREPDEQYRTRVGREINNPLTGTLDFDSVYAFRMTPAKVLYDAKAGQMAVRCALSRVFEKGTENPAKKAFVVRYQPLLDNRHTITGAGGGKRVIEEVKFNEYAVVPAGARLPGKTSGVSGDQIEAAFPLKPDEARQSEGNVMALLIGKLTEPYATYEEVIRKSAPETPGSYEARYFYIHLRLDEIWFYDVRTGKVFKKLAIE